MAYSTVLSITRWLLPLISIGIFVFWFINFSRSKRPKKVLAILSTENDAYVEITATESVIGRSGSCDVRVPLQFVPRKHSLLIQKKNHFVIIPLKGKLEVNDNPVNRPCRLRFGDTISVCGQKLFFDPPEEEAPSDEYEDIYSSDSSEDFDYEKAEENYPSGLIIMILLSAFQLLMCWQISARFNVSVISIFPLSIVGFIAVEWCYYFANRMVIKGNFLAEPLFFYLATVGLSICFCFSPESFSKQLICMALGAFACAVLWIILSRLEWVEKLRYIVGIAAILLLIINLIFGSSVNGSKNWLVIGPLSFQPSELVKVMFIFAGASVLSKSELQGRGFYVFLGFSCVCMGALALMVDFGAVSIFFVTMLIILLMRLTSVWIVGGLTLLSAGAAGALILIFPHIMNRFSAWTNVWQYSDSLGYQQTRTLIYSASGGLLGLGGGNGALQDIVAADTDLVFGLVSEEWGLIIAICIAICFVLLGVYALRIAREARSVYYSIAVCACAGMMLFQTALNIFGSTDILPLTGVTIPLVSNGGTSMIAGFCMLAFFKAAEKRAVPMESQRRRFY